MPALTFGAFVVWHKQTRRGTLHARQAECEHVLRSLANQARVVYARNGTIPTSLTGTAHSGGCDVEPAELHTRDFVVQDKVATLGDNEGELFASPKHWYDDDAVLRFDWRGGGGHVTWR
ncbi:MAG: hypothetical protein KF696_04805 [Planctomycetes bacterium]|nr:hypothetical protein [Planctomycetota bacterium]MCW8134293.1 hypothetical protein [Planctomycetota bacterium]